MSDGPAAVRQSTETLRAAEGDDATDAALAEIDEAVAHIEAEDASTALKDATNDLSVEIVAAGGTVDNRDDTADSVAVLDTAEPVCDSWGASGTPRLLLKQNHSRANP